MALFVLKNGEDAPRVMAQSSIMSLADSQSSPDSRTGINAEHLDVLIIGAGLSGVGAAYHVASECPNKSFALLEARETLGGTWDLFRYPGVRSDSDMFTLGFGFNPWSSVKAIADGPSILAYIRNTARKFGIDKKIRYNERAIHAAWSAEDGLWTVEVEAGPAKRPLRYTCSFLYMCSGYYDYGGGYLPEWPGYASYRGTLVHPQRWPDDLDYAGKRVLIIGSGATAVTLAPELAKRAAHVTVLQRSPTYIVARPGEDAVAKAVRFLPKQLSGPLVRWKNLLLGIYFFNLARKKPDNVKSAILAYQKAYLGDAYDYAHLTPAYNPWDQRLCLVPDGDLFHAIRAGTVELVTDSIERFDEAGVVLASGRRLDADIVVTATGLQMQLFGGMTLSVNGRAVDPGKALMYKGMMLSDVPNFASAIGYTNASWTLRCELTSEYVCRLINYLDRRGYAYCTPRRDASATETPVLELTSGYVLRGAALMPKQGSRAPWRLYQNYVKDLIAMRFGKVADAAMEFTPAVTPSGAPKARSRGAAANVGGTGGRSV